MRITSKGQVTIPKEIREEFGFLGSPIRLHVRRRRREAGARD